MATAASTSSSLFSSLRPEWPFVKGAEPLQNLLPGYEVVPATDSSPAYAVFSKPIQKSLNDDREYRYALFRAAPGERSSVLPSSPKADTYSTCSSLLRAARLIMLENGLEALLIRDEKTDKASAALDVKVGHLADPEDLQGLAHFCEHLLFMGTEKVSSNFHHHQPSPAAGVVPSSLR